MECNKSVIERILTGHQHILSSGPPFCWIVSAGVLTKLHFALLQNDSLKYISMHMRMKQMKHELKGGVKPCPASVNGH
jgi:hypothetical protein